MTGNESIYEALAVIAQAAETSDAKWVVGGSAALMLRGLPLAARPRDLDIYCDDEDVEPLFELLARYSHDEPAYSRTPIYRSRLCHFTICDAAVELVGGFRVTAIDSDYTVKVKELLFPYGDKVSLPGLTASVKIVPLAHELVFNVLRERQDRVGTILEAIKQRPDNHLEALRRIVATNNISDKAKEQFSLPINEMRDGVRDER